MSPGWIAHQTIRSVVWWIATLVCVAGSFALIRAWSGPLALWIAVAVMDVIPVGVFALALTLVIKARSTFKAHGAPLPTEPVVGGLIEDRPKRPD